MNILQTSKMVLFSFVPFVIFFCGVLGFEKECPIDARGFGRVCLCYQKTRVLDCEDRGLTSYPQANQIARTEG